MIDKKIILVLSDSTSASYGLERKIHHMQLADRKIWLKNTTILNCSIPGMTSADAATYFKKICKKYKSIVSVFIYLGNCDAIAMENSKGKFTNTKYLKHKIKHKLYGTKPKSKLRNSLLYNEWNNKVDLNFESPEDPLNFKKNIQFITKFCKKKSIPVLLVKSEANKYFIPGLAKGNFLFYKYLGLDCRLGKSLKHDDERINLALSLHDDKKYREATIEYKNILDNPIKDNISREYGLVILNNYAVAKAELNEFDEAKTLLNFFLEEKNSRKEIAYYNLAQIAKNENKIGLYHEMLENSFDSDHYMYRVRKPYQDILQEVADEDKTIHFIEMDSLLNSDDFLDHCHPLPKGQKILANAFERIYKSIGLTGNQKSTIENDLFNPEFSNGNFAPFIEYFRCKSNLSKEEINLQFKFLFSNLDESLGINENSQIDHDIQNAYNYYFKHPLFTDKKDIKSIKTFYPSDVGRFPEFMFYRFLIPYIKKIEDKDKELLLSYNKESQLVSSSNSYQQLLLDLKINDLEIPTEIKSFTKRRISNILERVKESLSSHLQEGNQISNRTKTTIFWYFRETLRFGSHSRYSMRYNRVIVEYISEALILCEYFNKVENYSLDKNISKLKNILLSTVKIHEEYCSKFKLQEIDSTLIIEYDNQLKQLFKKLG